MDLTVLQQVEVVVGEVPHRWVLLHLDAGAHLRLPMQEEVEAEGQVLAVDRREHLKTG